MKKALFIYLIIIFIFSCQDDIEQGNHLVRVMTRTDCQSNVLVEEQDVIIKIYSIESRFDFSEKELIEILSSNFAGSYFTNLELGNYYCEVIKEDGTEVFSGIFKLPTDFDEEGNLNLVKGRKTGGVYERLDDGSIGQFIPNSTLIHRNEITGQEHVVQSDDSGRICIEVNPGRYYVEVNHENYQTYTTEQGFSVFYVGMNDTSNFFLRE